MTMKPNCYECVHRRKVPGSAHSACAHPATQATSQSPFMQLGGDVGKRGGDQLAAMADHFMEGPRTAAATLGIKAAEQGIRNGWFVWPVNFDPTWLEECRGFIAKSKTAEPEPSGESVEAFREGLGDA